MRSSLVGLQLLLACVLVWGTSVPEEKKECCGPGVPPEESCCPPGNSTSQEPEKEEGKPEEPNSEEEMEKREKEYRERVQQDIGSPYEFMFLKEQALDYFHKHHTGAFYRPTEDTDIQVEDAIGTIVTFTQYLVNTNCTKEEGRRFAIPWYERPESTNTLRCVALPKQEQKKLRCRVSLFIDAASRRSAVLSQDCEPVIFMESSDDPIDTEHLMDSFHEEFDPFF